MALRHQKQTGPLTADNQPEELKKLLKKCVECMETAEPVHKVYRGRWDELYGLYRSYRKLVNAYSGAENDRDRSDVLGDAQRDWGAELFVPYAFATVETIVPRLLANDPTMLVRPRTPSARESAEAVAELINNAQGEISYELKLQPTARRGLKYGIGVQKTFWGKKSRRVIRTEPSASGVGYAAVPREHVLYEGPDVEDVDIWDFFWDPVASSIETASWVLHRTWRSDDYVKRMVEQGKWYELDLERAQALRSDQARDDVWAERMAANGIGGSQKPSKLHEVWEYHDGENVYTVLDRALVVQAHTSPFYHREIPFQIFRPTPVEGEFVGIGEIEPIAGLQRELNTLRTQRRDNATMALMRAFIYREGRVDPNTLKIGPGVGIPVQGSPKDDIVPLVFPDLPASSYQEEVAIKQDMELASGISEATAGGTGGDTAGTETATGIQLVQQAANVRIRLKTKNLERETIKPAGRQFLELFRQHFIEPKQVRVTDTAMEEGYRFATIGPDQLLDDIDDPLPDAGSTEPDNKLEREQRAATLFTALAGNPLVDQKRALLHYLKELGVRDAESFLAPETPKVDPRVVGIALQRLGVEPDVIQEAIEGALEAEAAAEADASGEAPAEPVPQEA